MSKHTPGKWKYDEESENIVAPWTSVHPRDSNLMGDYRGAIIADIACSHGSGQSHSRDFARPEAKANARLIACAPELLEIAKAYRNLLRTMAHTEGEVETFQHIEGVIARAEGRDE